MEMVPAADVKPLGKVAAERLTAKIVATAAALPELVVDAYDGQAWVAMGLDSFEEYCEQKLNLTRSSGWRTVKLGRLQKVTSVAAGGAQLQLSQRAAADIEPHIDEVIREIAKVTEKAKPEDKTGLAEGVIASFASRARDKGKDKAKTTAKGKPAFGEVTVRLMVPAFLKPVWPGVERAAAAVGQEPTEWALDVLQRAVVAAKLPPVEVPEKPAKAKQSSGRESETEGQSSEPTEVVAPVEPEPEREGAPEGDPVPAGDPFAPNAA